MGTGNCRRGEEFKSQDEAFGYAVSYMNENNAWGNGPGWAQSPEEALQNYNNATGTSGITESMWNGYMENDWAGYASNLITGSSIGNSGKVFVTTGLTFANADMWATAINRILYSDALQKFLGTSNGGMSGWDKANLIMGASGVGLGAQEQLIDYAVRSSFKSRQGPGVSLIT